MSLWFDVIISNLRYIFFTKYFFEFLIYLIHLSFVVIFMGYDVWNYNVWAGFSHRFRKNYYLFSYFIACLINGKLLVPTCMTSCMIGIFIKTFNWYTFFSQFGVSIKIKGWSSQSKFCGMIHESASVCLMIEMVNLLEGNGFWCD